MFKNSIDNKESYYDSKQNIMIDLGEPIFDKTYGQSTVFSFYRLDKSMEMRPDLASIGMYGTDEYTEMVLKYAGIDNPFTVEQDDLLYLPSLNTIDNDIRPIIAAADAGQSNSVANAIKNYHKYIDPGKAPANPGSQVNSVKDKTDSNINNNVSSSGANSVTGILRNNTTNGPKGSNGENTPTEANLSNGNSGITIKNGKIYFGDSGISTPVSDITDIDNTNKTASDLVDCARNGITIGQFLDLTTKNSLK